MTQNLFFSREFKTHGILTQFARLSSAEERRGHFYNVLPE